VMLSNEVECDEAYVIAGHFTTVHFFSAKW
jgi:hypothetical protein